MKKISLAVSLTFLVVFFIAINAQSASDWQNYGSDHYGTLSYKKGDIDKKGGQYIVQAWKQRAFSATGRKKYIEATKKGGIWTEELDKISNVVSLNEIDCKQLKHRQTAVVLYDEKSNKISSLSNAKANWTAITPGSDIDSLRKKVCDKI